MKRILLLGFLLIGCAARAPAGNPADYSYWFCHGDDCVQVEARDAERMKGTLQEVEDLKEELKDVLANLREVDEALRERLEIKAP